MKTINTRMMILKLKYGINPITITKDDHISGERIQTIIPLKAMVTYRIGTKQWS
jgi:hypothetical protein